MRNLRVAWPCPHCADSIPIQVRVLTQTMLAPDEVQLTLQVESTALVSQHLRTAHGLRSEPIAWTPTT